MTPTKRSTPTKAAGTVKAAGATNAPGTVKVTGATKATRATKATGTAKATGAKKAIAAKKVTGTAKASGPAKASGAAKKAIKQTSSGTSRSSRRDIAGLIADVRTALDDLAQKGDAATKPGRDRVNEQVANVEVLWTRVKHELGLGRAEGDAAVESLRSALGKAEEAVTHMIDAAVKVLKGD